MTENGTLTCSCQQGFTGDHCEHCTDLKCKNNGVCQFSVNRSSYCECPK